MTWAICRDCKKEMKPSSGCTFKYLVTLEKKYWARVPNEDTICHDCNAGMGKYHYFGCDWERCPQCGGQLISCDCGETFNSLSITKK